MHMYSNGISVNTNLATAYNRVVGILRPIVIRHTKKDLQLFEPQFYSVNLKPISSKYAVAGDTEEGYDEVIDALQ